MSTAKGEPGALMRGARGAPRVVVRRTEWTPPSLADGVRANLIRHLESSHNPLWPWWKLRELLGGRVSSSLLREVLDELLSEGEAIELTLVPRGRSTPRHVVCLTSRIATREWEGVIEARGREDVLTRLGLTEDALWSQ